MSASLDRRTFLTGSAKTAAAVAAVGAGGSLLAACGGSSGGGGGGGNRGGAKDASKVGVSSATPKAGGTLNVGMAGDVDGFDPAANHWDADGLIYAHTIYDSLGVLMPDGTVAPYLAKSIEHNADYTQWTITVRDGVTFHDGEKLDGAAVVANFQAMRKSPLAGPALDNLTDVKVSPSDPMAAVLTMKESWVPFDQALAGGIGGQDAYMVSPKAIAAGTVSTHPVGTGPYVFVEWKPNDHLTVKKNPNYWQQGKPYLDSIVFRPIPDSQARGNSLKAGNVDLILISSGDNVLTFRDDKNVAYLDNTMVKVLGEPTAYFFQVNCLSDPLKDVRLREALAWATDKEKIVKVGRNGVGDPSINGPFTKDSPYYIDSGYPEKQDIVKAKSLVDAWSKENGGKKPSFKLASTTDPATLQIAQLTQAMWQQAGFQVQIDQVELAQYITKALVGDYDVVTWAQFGATDPDANYIWWSTETIGGIGALSLNFARNKDGQIQEALETGRTSTDQQKRVEAYQSISKRFAVDYPYIWYSFEVAGIAANPKVQDWAKIQDPDGKQAANLFSNQSPYSVNWWLQA